MTTQDGRSNDQTVARRVLIVASELPPGPGGIGSHAVAVASGLHDQGWDVTLLGSQHYVDAAERDSYNSDSHLTIRTLPDAADPARTAWARVRAIKKAVEQTRPNVIVASGGRIVWLTAPVARRAHVPMVAVAHGSELGGPRWQRLLTRRSFDVAQRVIAVSEFTAGLTRSLGVTRPIDVIPNGAEAERFSPSTERRERFRSRHRLGDRPVVLTVGNVTERKGQHLVVDALPHLLASSPDAMYVLVGLPSDADALTARAERLGVDRHLLVLGKLDEDEVVDAHAAADVFAMTSTSTGSGDVEGYGIAVIEAALSGVPAVVTSGTGAAEAVLDETTGLAVPSEPAAIAQAISRLLADNHAGGSFGANAERLARTEGSWTHRVTRYGQVLDEVTTVRRSRIVVVSHTEHWRTDDGTIVGFGATTRELDHLATLFSELVHVAPLYDGPPAGMALPATAPNIRLVPVPPAGGSSTRAKLGAIATVPRWAMVITREVSKADVVHVRCPAGISMVALVVLLLLRRSPRRRWVKYAGNWMPPGREATSYRVQRWWLGRGLARATVTVNGHWPDQPAWVHAFDNPTLTESEIRRGRHAAEAKRADEPWRVVFSGRLERPKGADVAVETVRELRRRGHHIELDLIGDGPLREWVDEQISTDVDGSWLRLHGWLTRQELETILADGHVFLLPTASEGFPKVIAEAMAFGCVPVTSRVSSIGQVLDETGGAVVVTLGESWADAVEGVLTGSWAALKSEGLSGVDRFSYSTYLDRLRQLLMVTSMRPQ